MKVVILCGGWGTRIKEVSDTLPKPMMPIGRFPILWHIMKYYAHFDYNQFVLCLGYKSSVIKDFFLNYKAHTEDLTLDLSRRGDATYYADDQSVNWKVTLAETGLNTMTGGRIKKIQKYVSDADDFLLTYGDGVGDVDIPSLIKFHKSHGKILTVTGVRPPGRFGEIVSETDGTVKSFNEKPQTTGGRISGGFFVCRREIFEYIDPSDSVVFEQGPILSLVKDKQIKVFEHDGFWQPMDTHREYILLNDLFEKGKAPWVIWDK